MRDERRTTQSWIASFSCLIPPPSSLRIYLTIFVLSKSISGALVLHLNVGRKTGKYQRLRRAGSAARVIA